METITPLNLRRDQTVGKCEEGHRKASESRVVAAAAVREKDCLRLLRLKTVVSKKIGFHRTYFGLTAYRVDATVKGLNITRILSAVSRRLRLASFTSNSAEGDGKGMIVPEAFTLQNRV